MGNDSPIIGGPSQFDKCPYQIAILGGYIHAISRHTPIRLTVLNVSGTLMGKPQGNDLQWIFTSFYMLTGA